MRTVCRCANSDKKPLLYRVDICKLMLKRLQTAGGMLSAAQIIGDAIMAQTSRTTFLEQYFYVTQKLSTTLWGVLRNLLRPGTSGRSGLPDIQYGKL